MENVTKAKIFAKNFPYRTFDGKMFPHPAELDLRRL
jgi:hypothetical protein